MDVIANMTAEQMANTPAGIPPPGITPNLSNPPSDGYIMVVVGSIGMAVTLTAATLRFYAKLFIRKKMRPDDWTALVATVGSIGYFSNCILAVVRGKYGVHMWNLSIAHIMSNLFIISSYFLNWVSALIRCFAKTSFFLMYLDIFGPVEWQRYTIYFGLLVTFGFYISTITSTIYFTSPAPGQSWRESFISPRYRRNFNSMMPIVVGSFLIDMYILLLPMLFISPLQMSLRKKIGVLTVFATGSLSCVASTLRIYYTHVLGEHTDDFTYYTLRVLIMSLLEMCAGITASSMPSMVYLYRRRVQGSPSAAVKRTPCSKDKADDSPSSRTWVAMTPYQKKADASLDDHSETRYFRHMETMVERDTSSTEVDDSQIHLRDGLAQNTSPREVV
ncbi:hypothetical protein BO71DRAFT_391299 [Aspergillus ellipticus CBS 707.79]|uniref:Rhodopsin domain-containing protein n=1 Tax=Aspergillus ellipticus CBS 707.79 TaxID=1448320 RepID=A0A319D200_9EURO|nr:hypothetical protein BO71DRAFT_391299 [Aspergillus ellipticus CBS 707.79]